MIEYKIFKILTAAPPLVIEAELNELVQERWIIEFVDSGFIFLAREIAREPSERERGPQWPEGPEMIEEGDVS